MNSGDQINVGASLKFVGDIEMEYELIELLHESTRSLVHRARRIHDGLLGNNKTTP